MLARSIVIEDLGVELGSGMDTTTNVRSALLYLHCPRGGSHPTLLYMTCAMAVTPSSVYK